MVFACCYISQGRETLWLGPQYHYLQMLRMYASIESHTNGTDTYSTTIGAEERNRREWFGRDAELVSEAPHHRFQK